MQVSDIMTREPVWVTPDCSLDDALRVLDEQGFRHLPVQEGGRLVGMISDRDLLAATGGLPSRVHACRGPGMREQVPARVAEIMSRDVATIGPSAPLRAAGAELQGRRIGCLPVVEDGRLVGIVTEGDLLRLFVRAFEPHGPPRKDAPTVARRMTRDVQTIECTTSLEDALSLCRSADIRHLPVLQQELVFGLVSDRDLRGALGAGRRPETPVEALMTWELVTVTAETPLAEAARIMVEGKLGALPVVREDELVGIVTSADVLDHCLELLSDDKLFPPAR